MRRPAAGRARAERRRTPRRRALALLLAAALAFACHTPRVHSAAPALLARPELAFLRDGAVTRADVLLELGEPSAAFEGERVLTYELDRRPDGSLRTRLPPALTQRPAAWHLSLVLVFRDDGVLERHSVVVAE